VGVEETSDLRRREDVTEKKTRCSQCTKPSQEEAGP